MSTLAWSHRASEVREAKTFAREADAGERARMSERIGNAECLALAVDYTIRPDGDARYIVDGRVKARLEQTCGVTLEPIFQDINEVIDVAFEADARRQGTLDVGFDPLEDDPPEEIRNGRIEIGEIIAEIVALAADPFPRSPDEELERWEAGGDEGDGETRETPFAKLRALSPRSGTGED
jgi:uncharacterized metal-binding protein YceD (DUF177 family)